MMSFIGPGGSASHQQAADQRENEGEKVPVEGEDPGEGEDISEATEGSNDTYRQRLLEEQRAGLIRDIVLPIGPQAHCDQNSNGMRL